MRGYRSCHGGHYIVVNKYKHWQHLCKGNAKWFKKVQQLSSVDKLLVSPHFPSFFLISPISPHFSSFSLIFPHFPSFFPFIPFFRGVLDTGILRIWILPKIETATLHTGSGEWNSCNTPPHYLGVVGGGTRAMNRCTP